jgi:ribosome-associated translation inhibitor RaiA
MIQVKFKNMTRSDLVKTAVLDRIEPIIEKFDELRVSKIVLTLEMQNSPTQSGPDLFSVKLNVRNGRFKGTVVSKSDANLYRALAELSDHMLEKLNRSGDRDRVKERSNARRLIRFSDRELAEHLLPG